MVSTDKPDLEVKVGGPTVHFPNFPTFPRVPKRLLYGGVAGVLLVAGAGTLVYFALRDADVPSTPLGLDNSPGQEQQYNPNGDGLPAIVLPTAVPVPTATASPVPTPEPGPTPLYIPPTPFPTAIATSVPPTPVPTPTTPPPTPTPYNPPTPTPPQTPTPQQPTVTPMPTATAVARLTQEQLRQNLEGLEGLLMTNENPVLKEGVDYNGYAQRIVAAYKAGHQLVTGKLPEEHGIELRIFPNKAAYDKFIDERGISQAEKNHASFSFTSGTSLKTKTIIGVNGTESVRYVFDELIHNDGHATAAALKKFGGSGLPYHALLEAQAFTFEAAWYRRVNEFRGVEVLYYPKTPAVIKWINDAVDFYAGVVKKPITLDTRHAVGSMLPWLRAREKGMLVPGQQLSSEQSYELFLDLVKTPKNEEESAQLVTDLLAQAEPDLKFVWEHATSRLKEGYSPPKESFWHPRIVLFRP